MQKIINFRSIFFLFILSMLCIFFSFKATFNLYYLFLAVFPILFFIFLVFKKKYVFLIVSLLILIYFSVYTSLYVKNFENNNYTGISHTISGKIIDKQEYTYSTSLILSKVTLLTEDGNEINLKGNLSLNISDGIENYDVGYIAVFNAKIKPVNLINSSGEINTKFVKNNIRYSVVGTVNAYNTTFIEGRKPLNQTIKNYNRQLLINNLGETKGNLAYALIYGDRTEVDTNLMDTFKYSGVVHIFAVSGLHISIIVGVVYFILRKLKCNNKMIFAILTILLLFYCYLCSYSSSVVRATIMSLTLLLSKIVFKKNDSLSTLSFSGLLILIVSPLSLFDAGFQMSFCAVFGIIIFSDLFNKVKIKNSFLKKVFLLIAVSLSTQIALLPLFAKYYGYYSTWSVLANLVTLPLFSIFYPILFVTNLLCLVFNFLGFLFFLPNAFLSIIIYLNKLISYLPFGKFPIFYCGGLIAVLYYCYLFFTSKYILINKKVKPVITGIGFVIVFCIFSFNTLPLVSTNNQMAFASNYYSNDYSALVSTENNENYLINPNMTKASLNRIKSYLNTKRISKLDGIIFSVDHSFEAVSVKDFLVEYSPKLYLNLENEATENLLQMGISVKEVENNIPTKINNQISIQYFKINNKFQALLLIIKNYLYLEITFKPDNYLEYELLEDFIFTNIDFRVNCVKINDTKENISYYKTLINANNYIFNEDNNITIKI